MVLPPPVHMDEYGKSTLSVFRGYNHNAGAPDGEFYDMRNLSGREYPLLATRLPRALIRTLAAPNGLLAANDSPNGEPLCWVDGASFYYGGQVKGTVANSFKTLLRMGIFILIFPDKAYYNTQTGVFGGLEYRYTSAANQIVFMDGALYGETAIANTIRSPVLSAFDGFDVGDAVTISGSSIAANNKTPIVREKFKDANYTYLRFYEDVFTKGTSATAVTFSRDVPDMDFLFVNENRLWGCRKDTIYCSKLGDPFNFNVFDGLTTDSWSVDVLSDGDFTGACAFLGYPCFFKRDHICKVYGTIPSDFQVMSAATLGVAPGSGASLAIAGETLFYLSRTGIVSYNGGMPRPVSDAFGNVQYADAVGGTDGLLYYVSMRDASGDWSLFVFDTQKRVWHREDDLRVLSFAWADTAQGRGGLYALTARGDILCLTDTPEKALSVEPSVEWFAETTDYTMNSPNRKWTARVEARLELGDEPETSVSYDIPTVASLLVSYDSGPFTLVRTETRPGKRSVLFHVVPRRCDHYRLRIEGVGPVRLYSLTQYTQPGSEIN